MKRFLFMDTPQFENEILCARIKIFHLQRSCMMKGRTYTCMLIFTALLSLRKGHVAITNFSIGLILQGF